jgi:hypothetical protein
VTDRVIEYLWRDRHGAKYHLGKHLLIKRALFSAVSTICHRHLIMVGAKHIKLEEFPRTLPNCTLFTIEHCSAYRYSLVRGCTLEMFRFQHEKMFHKDLTNENREIYKKIDKRTFTLLIIPGLIFKCVKCNRFHFLIDIWVCICFYLIKFLLNNIYF